MDKNKIILHYCPNFYKIINFDYFAEDLITDKLLKVYRSFIFSADVNNPEEIQKVAEIDKVLAKYVDDYLFRKEMKHSLTTLQIKKTSNVLQSLVDSIISIFNKYEEGTTRRIYVSRWI